MVVVEDTLDILGAGGRRRGRQGRRSMRTVAEPRDGAVLIHEAPEAPEAVVLLEPPPDGAAPVAESVGGAAWRRWTPPSPSEEPDGGRLKKAPLACAYWSHKVSPLPTGSDGAGRPAAPSIQPASAP